jgi:hypothetical protein
LRAVLVRGLKLDLAEPGGFEEQHDLRREVEVLGEGERLFADDRAGMSQACPHLDLVALLERIERRGAGDQLDLVAVSRSAAVAFVPPGARDPVAMVRQPARLVESGPGHLLPQEERAAGLEVVVDATEGLLVATTAVAPRASER